MGLGLGPPAPGLPQGAEAAPPGPAPRARGHPQPFCPPLPLQEAPCSPPALLRGAECSIAAGVAQAVPPERAVIIPGVTRCCPFLPRFSIASAAGQDSCPVSWLGRFQETLRELVEGPASLPSLTYLPAGKGFLLAVEASDSRDIPAF